jgi:DnaJ-domain-containing protein 1
MHPLFFDDLIALGVLGYLWYRNTRQKKRQYSSYTHNQSQREFKQSASDPGLSLEDAFRILDLTPDASFEDAKKAYKEKVVKSHPDKVSHLSKELQEKARELTLKLNSAFALIKRHKKIK